MASNDKFASKYISHYAIRARQLGPMIEWYKKFFDATVEYDAGFGVFMTFDDEHHRLVIWSDDETAERVANSAGVDHVAIGLPNAGEMAVNYERLRSYGIVPKLAVNHHFTTSMYYDDPDGNEVEFTIDNFSTKAECSEFVRSAGMAKAIEPPYFGAPFDPEEFVRRVRAGEPQERLARIGLDGIE